MQISDNKIKNYLEISLSKLKIEFIIIKFYVKYVAI